MWESQSIAAQHHTCLHVIQLQYRGVKAQARPWQGLASDLGEVDEGVSPGRAARRGRYADILTGRNHASPRGTFWAVVKYKTLKLPARAGARELGCNHEQCLCGGGSQVVQPCILLRALAPQRQLYTVWKLRVDGSCVEWRTSGGLRADELRGWQVGGGFVAFSAAGPREPGVRHVSWVCRGGWPRLPGAEKLSSTTTSAMRLTDKQAPQRTPAPDEDLCASPHKCRSLVQPGPPPDGDRMADRSHARFASAKPRTLPAAASSRSRFSPYSCSRSVATAMHTTHFHA